MGAFSHKFSIAPSGETTDRIKKVRGMQKWDEPLLSTMPSMMEIVGRAPAVASQPVLFLLSGPIRSPVPNFTFSMGKPLPMPNFTFIGAEMWEYSPQNCKMSNFGHKFTLRGDSFAIFLRYSERLYASILYR